MLLNDSRSGDTRAGPRQDYTRALCNGDDLQCVRFPPGNWVADGGKLLENTLGNINWNLYSVIRVNTAIWDGI